MKSHRTPPGDVPRVRSLWARDGVIEDGTTNEKPWSSLALAGARQCETLPAYESRWKVASSVFPFATVPIFTARAPVVKDNLTDFSDFSKIFRFHQRIEIKLSGVAEA